MSDVIVVVFPELHQNPAQILDQYDQCPSAPAVWPVPAPVRKSETNLQFWVPLRSKLEADQIYFNSSMFVVVLEPVSPCKASSEAIFGLRFQMTQTAAVSQ